jgi:hypothetical protein
MWSKYFFFNPVGFCVLYKAKVLSSPPVYNEKNNIYIYISLFSILYTATPCCYLQGKCFIDFNSRPTEISAYLILEWSPFINRILNSFKLLLHEI